MLDINVLENVFEAGPPESELFGSCFKQSNDQFQRVRKSQLHTMTLIQQLEMDDLPIVDNEQDQIDMLIALQSKHRAEVIDMYQQHQALYEKLSAYYDEWA